MQDITTTNTTDTAKISQVAAGLLSQLSTALGGNTVRDKLFASILAQDQSQYSSQTTNLASQQNTNSKTNTSNLTQSDSDNNVAQGTVLASSAGHDNLTDTWRAVLDKIRARAKPAYTTEGTSAKTNSQDTSSPSSASSSGNGKPSSMIKGNSATSDIASRTSKDTSDTQSTTDPSNDPNNLSPPDILAQLQTLAQELQKQLQAMQTSSTNDGSTTPNKDATTGAKDSTADGTDALSVPDILSQFLSLSQQLEQGLQTAASAGTSSATTNGASVAPAANLDLTTLEAQLKTDLKSLLAAIDGSDTSSSTQIVENTANIGAATSAPSQALADTPQPTSQAQDIAKSLLAVSNDFINLFANNLGTPALSASAANNIFVPLNDKDVLASTDNKGGTFLDNSNADDADPTAVSGRSTDDTAGLANAIDNSKSANPYSFASQLSATRASSGTTGLPSAVEQVILQMNKNVKSGDDQMSIQLHPADLGKINIKLDITSDGKVQGTVVASNPATLDLLHKDVRSLERALQEAGLRADPGSLQFSMSGQSGNSSGQNADGTSSKTSAGISNDTVSSLATVSTDASDVWYVTPGRVNFKV